MPEIKIWPKKQMVYTQSSLSPEEWDTQTPLVFWYTNGSPYLGQTSRPNNNQQEKEKIVEFAVPADQSKIERK